MNDQGQKGSKNEPTLLAHSDDWRNALPALQEGKDYVFLDLPASHHEYNAQYFAHNVFETPLEIPEGTKLLLCVAKLRILLFSNPRFESALRGILRHRHLTQQLQIK